MSADVCNFDIQCNIALPKYIYSSNYITSPFFYNIEESNISVKYILVNIFINLITSIMPRETKNTSNILF